MFYKEKNCLHTLRICGEMNELQESNGGWDNNYVRTNKNFELFLYFFTTFKLIDIFNFETKINSRQKYFFLNSFYTALRCQNCEC